MRYERGLATLMPEDRAAFERKRVQSFLASDAGGWIDTLQFRKGIGPKGLEQLVQKEYLANFTGLLLGGISLWDDAVVTLANSPNVRSIQLLDLSGCKIKGLGVEALANSPHLRNLQELRLAGSSVQNGHIEQLADSPNASNLVALNLMECNLRRGAVKALTKSKRLEKLQRLNLHNNNIGDNALTDITEATWVSQLRDLDVGGRQFSPDSTALRTIFELPYLKSLNLRSFRLERKEVADAFASMNLPELELLDLGGAKLHPTLLDRLSTSANVPKLKVLMLSGDEAQLSSLLESNLFQQLEVLSFPPLKLKQTLATLTKNAATSQLAALKLNSWFLEEKAARTLLASSNFPNLRYLHLGAIRRHGSAVIEALATSPLLDQLQGLYLDDADVTQQLAEALIAAPNLLYAGSRFDGLAHWSQMIEIDLFQELMERFPTFISGYDSILPYYLHPTYL